MVRLAAIVIAAEQRVATVGWNNPMKLRLGIIEVDHQSDQTLLVNFNDGTYAFFSVFQLAALQPERLVGDGENAEAGQ